MKKIIHRGLTSKKNKENSYMAIKRAFMYTDSDGVEFDIRLTKDKRIVLSHSSVVENILIEKSNYLDIIKRKYLDTLDKILSINTDKIFLIDIKENNNYKEFGDKLIDELHNADKNIYLASFNKKIIRYLRKKTKYKTGIISFYYRKNKDNFTVINHNFVNLKILKKIKNNEIFIWTLNSNEYIEFSDKYSKINNLFGIMNKEE